jgi:hypothetical protein
MKQTILMLLAGAMLATGLSAQNGEKLMKLQEDLQVARTNAELTPEQNQKLDDALAKLRASAEARKNGGQPNREEVRTAMTSIREVSANFKEEDKAKIREDFKALMEGRKGGRQGRRQGGN